MTLNELRQQRTQKATRGKAAMTEYNALADKAERTAEEDARLAALDGEISALEAEVVDLDAKIEAKEKANRRAGMFSAPAPARSTARTVGEANPETTGGFRNLADFALSVRNASVDHVVDPRLAALPGNSHESSGTSGEGYLIPAEFRQQVMELVFNGDDLLNLVTPEPTSSNVVRVLRDETTPWGSSGVQASWRAEGSQMTPSKLDTKGSDVRLHELYAFVVATDELISDAPRLNDRLTRQAARAIRWKASDAIMWGDGVGKPLGFMNSAALVEVAKESGQAADTLVAANVAKMFSRILPGNIANTVWVANPDVIPQLTTMVLGNQPIWTPPATGFQNAPGGFLFGRPVILSEHADTLGDKGDIVLFDPAGYYAITKQGGGIDFASSIHLYFDYGAQAFRWTFRMGGQPHLSAPVTPARSAATKSHFVALADRA
jgi:HK97 family phage major capsid protein